MTVSQHKQAKSGTLSLAQETRFAYFHLAEPGVSLDDVCTSEYWSYLGRDLSRRPWTLIEVVAKDGTWECMLRVFSFTGHPSGAFDAPCIAKVRCLSKWQDKITILPNVPTDHAIDCGPDGWRVLSSIPGREVIATNLRGSFGKERSNRDGNRVDSTSVQSAGSLRIAIVFNLRPSPTGPSPSP